jgi:CHAT domain-containing protein/Flp pilus assembly protein TadD
MAQRIKGDSIGRKWLLVLLELVSLPGIVHRSLGVAIAVLLLSESVAATPKQFSPLLDPPPVSSLKLRLKKGEAKSWGGSPSIAQQSAATEQEATRTAAERAFEEGVQLYQQGTAESKRQAIAKFEEALPVFRAVGDQKGEAGTLLFIGRVYSDLGENQKALDYYNQSLPLMRALSYKKGEAVTLNSIGYIYNALGEKQKALEFYNQSLLLRRATGDKAGEAVILNNIGGVYDDLGEKQTALDYYNQALSLSRATGDKAGEAVTLNNIGRVYSALGEKQTALDYYNQALPLKCATGDKIGEATTLNNIGGVYSALGEKQKALEYLNQSLLLRRATGDKAGKAATLNNIGRVYSALGEKQTALVYYNQALPLSRATGDKAGEAVTLNNIGGVYDDLGEKQTALEFYNQALPLSRATKDKAGEAVTLINIGGVYNDLGEKQTALEYLNQAFPLSRATGDKAQEAATLINIGGVYDALGEKQKALEFYNQSLLLSRATGDKEQEATTLINIGGVYDALGEKQKALEFYNQSLPMFRATGDKEGEAATLTSIGAVYLSLGEKQKALEYFNQSLPLSRATGNKTQEAVTLNNIGGVYYALGEKQKALEFYNQALPLSRATGDKTQEALTLYNFAYLERNRSNLNEAFTHMKAAIEIIEQLRTNVASQELRASYFASKQHYYQFYIDLLMQLHKTNPSKGYDALALNASERARARNLLEILTEARADIRQGVDPKLREQERTLQQQLNAKEYRKYQLLNSQRGKKETEELNAIPKEIESLLTQLDDVRSQIRKKNPSYAAITQPGAFTLNLQQIQQQVLDDNTLLLEYSLGKERSYLWAVTKTGITSYELPKRADIEVAAKAFYDQLKSEAGSLEEGMKLSQMLLVPVASQLANKRLLIVSDGALQSIPFAALPIPNETSPPAPSLAGKGAGGLGLTPLLVNHEIVSLPSASTIAVLRSELKDRKPAPKTLVAIADPVFSRDDPRFKTSQAQPNNTTIPTEVKRSAFDIGVTIDRLEFSRKEAEQILSLVPENQRSSAFDFAASRGTATRPDLSQYRMVHFATHGLLNNVHPELSGVVLSLVDEKGTDADGFLRLHDIFNLNLPAELVVLSACETGLGKDVQGEGVVGLTRGFMYAGAKRVVVSLWNVKDSATAEMMKEFYQQMLSTGKNPVAALRAAQLEMWKTQQWKAPYYWAAFVVQGEWQ